MGYYKDTHLEFAEHGICGSYLEKAMPEKVGILQQLPSFYSLPKKHVVGEHDMKGHFHPSFCFVKRNNAKNPHVLIEFENARRYQRALEIRRPMRG